jgi:hypothetical protein
MNFTDKEMKVLFKAIDIHLPNEVLGEQLKNKLTSLNDINDTCPGCGCTELLCGHGGPGCSVENDECDWCNGKGYLEINSLDGYVIEGCSTCSVMSDQEARLKAIDDGYTLDVDGKIIEGI